MHDEARAMDTTFGTLLKGWRTGRRLSQLDLGLAANVSARHISFLETGRSRPSRSMVLMLSEALEVPRETRNGLLNAAGFSPVYRHRALDDADMAAVRAAVDWTLDRHDPFPAMAVDRHWALVAVNRPAAALLGRVGVGVGDSLLRAFIDSPVLRETIENWPQVARYLMVRIRTESTYLGRDPVLEAAADRLAATLPDRPDADPGVLPAIMPTRYRLNGAVLSLISTIAQFGTAEDVALADLRIELMFPADEATRQILLSGEKAAPGAG